MTHTFQSYINNGQRYTTVNFNDRSFTYWYERQQSTPCWMWTENDNTGHAGTLYRADSENMAILAIGQAAASQAPQALWAITTESASYSWEVFASSESEALALFRAMWLDWCKHTGADLDYWGADFDDVGARRIELGTCYMDREAYTS